MEYCKIKIHNSEYCINNNASVITNEPFIPQQCSLISKSNINEKIKKNLLSNLSKSHFTNTTFEELTSCHNSKTNWKNILDVSLKNTENSMENFINESNKVVPFNDKFQDYRIQSSICSNAHLNLSTVLKEFTILNSEKLLINKIYLKFHPEIPVNVPKKINTDIPKSPFIQQINSSSNFSVKYLSQLHTSKNILSEILSDFIVNRLEKILNETTVRIISNEKARSIKRMLNNLLKDIEKSKSFTKSENKYSNLKQEIKFIVKSFPSNCDKQQKIPADIDFQKAKSISDIIKLCSNFSLREKKYSDKKQLENPMKILSNPVKINKLNSSLNTNEVFEITKFKQLLPYNLNSDPNNIQKVFVLSPFDEIIKSHKSPTDRRLRAIANKMNCKIDIYGPLKVSHFTASFYTSREKVSYHCVISGESKSNLEKCLKCIKDTFPSSTIRDISLP